MLLPWRMIWGLLLQAMRQLKELLTTTPASLRHRVSFLLPESLVVRRSSPSMISPALFNNDAVDNIPSQHLCPITQEPPFDAIHFNAPTADGATIPNQQVYERSALYRYIATPGTSAREGISFNPSPVHLLHGIEHGTLSVPLSLLCRRLFTVSNLLLVFS
jgi:hypothetical protein